MSTNTCNNVSEAVQVARPVEGAAVKSELFLGIDAAAAKHVVTRFVPAEGVKPAEAMTTETLLRRVAEWHKAGVRVRTGRATCAELGLRFGSAA